MIHHDDDANLASEDLLICFVVQERNDLWEFLSDGPRIGGSYRQQTLEATRLAMQETFCIGGSSELNAYNPRSFGMKPDRDRTSPPKT